MGTMCEGGWSGGEGRLVSEKWSLLIGRSAKGEGFMRVLLRGPRVLDHLVRR
jgi:hypothetical protein